MTVNPDVMNVQPLVDDAYFHPANGKTQQVFPGSHGQETPGEAQKLLTQGKRVFTLRCDGTWHLDRNIEGEPEHNITIGYYDPQFRVRSFKLMHYRERDDTPILFGRIVYDTPSSHHVIDSFATGVLQPLWITRLYLGDPFFDDGTPGNEFSVSLIG